MATVSYRPYDVELKDLYTVTELEQPSDTVDAYSVGQSSADRNDMLRLGKTQEFTVRAVACNFVFYFLTILIKENVWLLVSIWFDQYLCCYLGVLAYVCVLWSGQWRLWRSRL